MRRACLHEAIGAERFHDSIRQGVEVILDKLRRRGGLGIQLRFRSTPGYGRYVKLLPGARRRGIEPGTEPPKSPADKDSEV